MYAFYISIYGFRKKKLSIGIRGEKENTQVEQEHPQKKKKKWNKNMGTNVGYSFTKLRHICLLNHHHACLAICST